MRRAVLWWGLFLLWAGLIAACSINGAAARPYLRGAENAPFTYGLVALCGAVALTAAARQLRGLPPGRRWLAGSALLACALLLGLLAWSQTYVEESLHVVTFGGLGFFAWQVCGLGLRGWPRLAAALLLGLAVGAGDELLQFYLPDRVGDIGDVITNAEAAWIVCLGLAAASVGARDRAKPVQFKIQ